MEKCCDNDSCKIIQIIPAGGWIISDEFGEPIVCWGLKKCGVIVPVVLTGEIEVGEASLRLFGDKAVLHHPSMDPMLHRRPDS